MPWSNQGGGGSGGGGRKGGNGGPWGSGGGGGGGGNQPPDLDEILRRGQDRMKQVMRGGGGGGSGGSFGGGVPRPFLFLIAMLALLGTGFYAFFFRVNPDEQGIVLRFGKFDRWESAGLHFRWPYPVEEVLKPKVTQQRTLDAQDIECCTPVGTVLEQRCHLVAIDRRWPRAFVKHDCPGRFRSFTIRLADFICNTHAMPGFDELRDSRVDKRCRDTNDAYRRRFAKPMRQVQCQLAGDDFGIVAVRFKVLAALNEYERLSREQLKLQPINPPRAGEPSRLRP